jgi:hypothetical protein
MSVAFPSGYVPQRDITITDNFGMRWTEMDDGSLRGIEVSTVAYTDIPVRLDALTQAETLALLDFFKTYKATEVTWTLDGIDYIGYIRGPVSRTMTGNWFSVSFVYYAKVSI